MAKTAPNATRSRRRQQPAVHHTLRALPLAQKDAPDNPEEVLRELEAIALARQGELQPRDVVERARDPESPLHGHFEWNDGAAAEAFRLSQARSLISSVRVNFDGAPADQRAMRVFISVPAGPDQGRHYELARIAMADGEKRQRILDQALRDIESVRVRYQELQELADVWAAAATVKRAS